MRIACYGDSPPKALLKVVRKKGHSIIGKAGQPADCAIFSGNLRKDFVNARKDLEAGTPVFVADALTASSLNTSDGGPIYIPYHHRFSPAYATLLSQERSGALGRRGFIKIHANAVTPKGYKPGKARSCSTLVYREMIHDIDWLNANFGPIRTVFCQGVQKKNPATEYAMASFKLKNGVIAQVIHSYQKSVQPSVRAEICGTEGIIQYDSSETPIRQTSTSPKSAGSRDDRPDVWAQHWEAFEGMIAKGCSTKQQRQLLHPLRIADLTIQSIISGEPKKV
jgi:predicted dehydrogenase